MQRASGGQSAQTAGKEMRPSAKWQLVDGQFNDKLPVINLWEQKPDLILWNQVS